MTTTTNGGTNALAHEIEIEVVRPCRASAAALYRVLADPRTHLVWGGEQQGKGARLVRIDPVAEPLSVGDEFTSTGVDLMGTFEDRSVVTEARPGQVLEFVTEATLTTKKGRRVDWTLVHRYEIGLEAEASRLTYRVRTTRISALPGPMRLFNVPVLKRVLLREAGKGPRRGVENLVRMAELEAAR